jgi:hypothetical protein
VLAAATHRTRAEVESLLAERYPRPDLPTVIRPLGPVPALSKPGPLGAGDVAPASRDGKGCEGSSMPGRDGAGLFANAPGHSGNLLAPEPVQDLSCQVVPEPLCHGDPRPTAAPIAARRYAWQVTVREETNDKLTYAQALLGHAVPSGDVAEVLDRALSELIAALERQKFAATARSRPAGRHASTNPRHVPAAVRCAVWTRDGGQCTYTSADGHRCGATSRLEYDHVEPVARGGQSAVQGLRLRCRAHHQLEAKRAFGSEFMQTKREEARRCSAEARRVREAPGARRAGAAAAGAPRPSPGYLTS